MLQCRAQGDAVGAGNVADAPCSGMQPLPVDDKEQLRLD